MRPAWMEVDLAAYRTNLRGLMNHTRRPALAVVKANAYGHGLVACAQAAVEEGCPGVAVALAEEGAELRASGFRERIVVLGLGLEEQASFLVEHGLETTVSRPELLSALSHAAARVGRAARVHVKVDTGMSRAGAEPDEALALCRLVREDPHLELAGVSTHFASAEVEGGEANQRQWEAFQPLLAEARAWSPCPTLHAANSPAGLWFPPAWLDWVRVGILSYGVPPAPERELPFPVRQVVRLCARVVQVKEVPAGRQVSYGGTWTAPRPSRLALLPLGYADGVPWALSNQGFVLIHGTPAPIRGRVCMDQLVVDVTDHPPVQPGEEAVLLGRQAGTEITVAQVAEKAGTLTYEVLTRLSPRLPRVYRS